MRAYCRSQTNQEQVAKNVIHDRRHEQARRRRRHATPLDDAVDVEQNQMVLCAMFAVVKGNRGREQRLW